METPADSEYRRENVAPLPTYRPRRRWRAFFIFLKLLAVLSVLALGLLSYEVISSGTSPQEVFAQLARLIGSGDRPLNGQSDGRINILLLGIGGSGHDGPLLTDSMLLASIRPSTQQVALISIPRDLQVDIPGIGFRRINNAYALAELKQRGSGGTVASATVSATFGVPIHYYLLLDFSGFAQLVDTLGGITVDVERPLDDAFYPIAGKENAPEAERYEHLYIPAGQQRFDGALALKYVRSRKAKGAEGSDFARSHRQQQVMTAIRDAAISLNVLRPGRLSDLLRLVNEHLDTNLQMWEMLRLYEISQEINPGTVIRHVFDDRPDGLLTAQMVDGAYVLVPRAKDFHVLQQIAADPFTALPITQPLPESAYAGSTSTAEVALPPPATGVRLQIQNGTQIPGLAARADQYFKDKDYTVLSVGNAPVQTYLRTVIYDLKPPANAERVRALGALLDAVTFDSGAPPPITTDGRALPYPVHPKADILIILGQNANAIIPEN